MKELIGSPTRRAVLDQNPQNLSDTLSFHRCSHFLRDTSKVYQTKSCNFGSEVGELIQRSLLFFDAPILKESTLTQEREQRLPPRTGKMLELCQVSNPQE